MARPGGRGRDARARAGALALSIAIAGGLPARTDADVTTMTGENSRASWYQDEPALAPATVGGRSFGTVASSPLDGQVYAQPLVVGDLVIVATENDSVYGISTRTGAVRWHQSIGQAQPASTLFCDAISPSVGITSTPVVDPATRTVYVLGDTPADPGAAVSRWTMHALDLATGAERPGWPVEIGGTASNAPGVTFAPGRQLQRPGLLLLNGTVYAGFASNCDFPPYRGWIAGVATSTARLATLWTTEADGSSASPSGGIWQSGAPLVSDRPGQIVVTTGNGDSPPPGPGRTSPPPTALGDAVLRLTVQSDGSLRLTDFFCPFDTDAKNQQDFDLGSSGPARAPDGFGTPAIPHLIVQGSKDGIVYVLDADHLGGRAQGASGSDAVVQELGHLDPVYGKAAFWGGDGGYVYLTGNGQLDGSSAGRLRAFARAVGADGRPRLAPAGVAAEPFGYASGSPVVTSDGTTPGSALVWVVQMPRTGAAGARLLAYDAVPRNGRLVQRASFPIGSGAKFSTPAASNGRVFLGTGDGHLVQLGTTAVTAPEVAPGVGPVTAPNARSRSSARTPAVAASPPAAPAGALAPTPAPPSSSSQGLADVSSSRPAPASRHGGRAALATLAALLVALAGAGIAARERRRRVARSD